MTTSRTDATSVGATVPTLPGQTWQDVAHQSGFARSFETIRFMNHNQWRIS
jgi:hypothetical protein